MNSAAIGADIRHQRETAGAGTAYLIVDTESVPDGGLIAQVKYPGANLSAEEAIQRAQADAREQSPSGSDFLPVTFQQPVSICVLRLAKDYTIQALSALDAPHFRPDKMVLDFWRGVAHYKPKLVTFNGRGFDLPLLEMAAFRHGCPARVFHQQPEPLQWQPHRPARLAVQLRRLPAQRRFEPAGQAPRQTRQNGNIRRPDLRHVPGRAGARDQRLLPVRHAGHLLCLSPDARAPR